MYECFPTAVSYVNFLELARSLNPSRIHRTNFTIVIEPQSPVACCELQSVTVTANANLTLPVREIRLSAGAEFIVVICGETMTMLGLPRVPSANHIRPNEKGEVEGLF